MKKAFLNTFILLIFSMLSLTGFAQDGNNKKNVTGTVVDFSGVPIPGVNVIEKGTNNGVVTDFDGKYSLTVNSKGTIVFSFIGMKTLEMPVEGKSVINASLKEDTESLDEVVVVGYGAQKRDAITSAIESIQGEEIEDLPVGNLGAALIGRVLGVGVSGGDSRPGQPARISIRSPLLGETARSKYSTALQADGPLYVIDGVVQIDPNSGYSDSTMFDNLDASQVESISFLKDAAAAIYGSRAGQGVVLVTTKRGKKGPAKFSYSGNFSVSDELYRTRVLNAYEYGRAFNIMNSLNPSVTQVYDPTDPAPNTAFFFSPTELEHFKTLNYNALDEYWSSAGTQRHNLNLSGGSEDATYFGGISYYTQDGNLGSLGYDRWSFRAGSNVNLGKGFKADFQVSGFFTDVSSTASSIGNQNGEDDYRQLLNRTPFMPMYVNGLPAVLIGSNGNNELFNVHYGELLRLRNISETTDNNVSININAEYDVPFIPGLNFKLSYSRQENSSRGQQLGSRFNLYQFFGADQSSTLGQTYVVYESGSGPLGTNTIRPINQSTSNPDGAIEVINNDRVLIDYGKYKNEQTRFQASYNRDFGKHNVSALFALEKAERWLNEMRVIKYGIPDWSDGLLWQATGNIDQEHTFNKRAESGDLGYIGRLNYSYDNKYYGEFLFRSDASAKFAPENYWGSFYSVSGGWIISRENFFKSNTIDFLKFRASVGLTGNDDIRPWQWLQRFGFEAAEGAVFGGNLSVSPGLEDSGQANRAIVWSEEIKTNFGLEAKFLDNRLSTTIENFYNIATDVLLDRPTGIPFTVGGSVPSTNSGRWDRWGMEVGLSWDDTIGDDFSYGINIITGWYTSKLIEGGFDLPEARYPWITKQPGNPDRGTWGYDYMGMFRTQADIDNYIAETGVTRIFNFDAAQLQPGMLYYRDVRGDWDPETRTFGPKDGVINQWDQIQLRKPARGPQGFSSAIDLKYKGFSFNTVLSVSWGGYREVGSAKQSLEDYRIGANYENRPAFWANMYHPDLNPTGTLPNLASGLLEDGGPGVDGGINTVSSRFWQVSSFSLLMRNINLSYTVPKTLVEKAGISSFRLNLVAMNPFVLFNPYKDYGLPPTGSYNSYPALKTYSLGVNIGF